MRYRARSLVGVSMLLGLGALGACGGSSGVSADAGSRSEASADGTGGEDAPPADDGGPLSEASADASTDAAIDATMDAPAEASPDAANDAPTDASTGAGDAATDAGADSAAADAGDGSDGAPPPPPVGTQLRQGDNLSVRGVTTDSYLVFSDDAALEAYAMPFAGGAVQDLGPLGSKFWNDQHGYDVFLWSNVGGSSSTGVGTLRVWSSATGLNTISTASFGIISAASASGANILYLDDVDPAGTVGDIYVAAANGTGKKKLVSQASIATCFPSLGFAGSYAVVSYCPAGSSGAFPETVTAFASPSWSTAVDVPATTGVWWSDDAGTELLYATAAGVSVSPLAGGAATLVDSAGTMGFLTGDGQAALYVTSSGAFRRSSVTSPSPTTLVPSGFLGWQGLSGDGAELLYCSNYTGSGIDLYVTSTTTPGAVATISSATVNSVPWNPFTTDASHALYYANGNTLEAYSLAGKTSVALGTSVFEAQAATAAKVVFTGDYVSTGGLRFGRGNLYAVDTAQAAAPTPVVTGTDAVFALAPALGTIAYAWSVVPGPNAGIWITPVP